MGSHKALTSPASWYVKWITALDPLSDYYSVGFPPLRPAGLIASARLAGLV
jgi:hypothetical protein